MPIIALHADIDDPAEMDFGGGFDTPNDVPDDLLDLGDLPDDIQIDPRGLGLTPDQPEISTQVTLPEMGDDDNAEDVESDLLGLLTAGRRATILAIAGERSGMTAAHSERDLLGSAYVRAARANPALRWYAKLAGLLPPDRFGVENGNLQIRMSAAQYGKTLQPFLGDFPATRAAHSPIIAAVRSLAAAAAAAHRTQVAHATAGGLARNRDAVAADVAAPSADFGGQVEDRVGSLTLDGDGLNGDDQITDSPDVTTAGAPAGAPSGAPAGAPSGAPAGASSAAPTGASSAAPAGVMPPGLPRIKLSLRDLSHKAVADHLAGLGHDEATLSSHLAEHGFTRADANSILAMVRYQKLASARRAGRYVPLRNTGEGNIDFLFR